MDSLCETCKYAEWDYEEYFGGGRQYFVCGCKKDPHEIDLFVGTDDDETLECSAYVMVEEDID